MEDKFTSIMIVVAFLFIIAANVVLALFFWDKFSKFLKEFSEWLKKGDNNDKRRL